ncbi:hypothetical protein SHIRM173S_13218 [Streptomyces hirsutus]
MGTGLGAAGRRPGPGVPGGHGGTAGLTRLLLPGHRGRHHRRDGAGARAPADRVIVNPDAFGLLGDSGRQVVVTHETTHVATRAHTTAATPLWLSEGFADWVGYRGGDRVPAEAAPELAREVGHGEVPSGLPGDDDFGFTADTDGLARAYESGWMACRLVAEHWGEERLGAFDPGRGRARATGGAVEDAMQRILGTTEEFTMRWQGYLREQFG